MDHQAKEVRNLKFKYQKCPIMDVQLFILIKQMKEQEFKTNLNWILQVVKFKNRQLAKWKIL